MKAKIKSLQGSGTFNTKSGTLMYKYEVELDDGISGTVNGTTEPYRFAIGDEVDYTVKGEYNGVKNLLFNKPDSQPFVKGSYKDNSNAILMQVCLKEVCEFWRTLPNPQMLTVKDADEIAQQSLYLAQQVKSNIEKL